MKVLWIDKGREPQCPPDPAHPLGIDVDVSDGAEATCTTALPYPAKRCGYYIITCPVCGYGVAVSTAGRPDDPRSVKVPCKIAGKT